MSKKVDLRTRITHKMIMDGLVELMVKKPFEEISVIDICDQAQVHRTTFYKHFEDKHHLLSVTILEIQKSFDELCRSDSNEYILPKDYYIRVFRYVLEYISKNNSFYAEGIFKQGNEYVSSVFKKAVLDYLKEHFQNDVSNHRVSFNVPIEIMAEYYTGAAISLTTWWLNNDMCVSIDTLVDYFDCICACGHVDEDTKIILQKKIR